MACAGGGRSVRREPSIGLAPSRLGAGSASGAEEFEIKDKAEYQIKRTENRARAVLGRLSAKSDLPTRTRTG